MNTELLLKVKERILAKPNEFDMFSFLNEQECGTTACIAGHAVILAGRWSKGVDYHQDTWERIGAEVLGLNPQDAMDLFFATQWDSDFEEEYCDAFNDDDKQKCAQVAADYLDYFIATRA